MKASRSATPKRKTLLEMAGEPNVRDPAAHAKRQVEELDKTAKRSQLRRKLTEESIEADKKEIAQLEHQLGMMQTRYDPLCEHLNDIIAAKKELEVTLDQCLKDQKSIMGEVKGVIFGRRIEDSKVSRQMGSYELEKLRGYSLKPESTFYQGRGLNTTSSFKDIFSQDRIEKDLKRTKTMVAKNAHSLANLPPLAQTSGFHKLNQSQTMSRNKSSTL